MGRGERNSSAVARRILLSVLVAVLAAHLLTPSSAGAEPVSQLHYSNYVNDFAHVLSDSTVSDLDDLCLQVDQKAHAQVAVVTINSLDGNDIESYSVDLFKKWGIGNKATNRGVLILLAVKDHRYRTEVGYGLEPILPDGKVGGFGRETVPLLKQGNYDGAVSLMTQHVANTIAQDAGIQLTGVNLAPPRREEPNNGISPQAVTWIFIIIVFILVSPLRKILFWWLLFSGGPRWGGGRGSGWGGFGGGGFGGGGGGFGGFGGGMSGGGGASGGW